MTAINDLGDFYYDVACRGALTTDIAVESFEDRIMSGAIINTDCHKAYPWAMEELKVASHIALGARWSTNLGRINEIHGNARTFFAPFRGVSTKWLHLYMGWFKWDRCYARDGRGKEISRKQIAKGDYIHRWRDIVSTMPIPFRDKDMNPLKRPNSCLIETF